MISVFHNQFKTVKTSDIPLEIIDPFRDLKDKFKVCSSCGKDILFGMGKPDSITFIGYIPSESEQSSGFPFSDKCNDIIYKVASYLSTKTGMKDFYYTNLNSCFCGKDTSSKQRLVAEMALIDPKIIIFLGHKIFNYINETDSNLDELRGSMHVVELDKFYPSIVTYTPKHIFLLKDKIKNKLLEDFNLAIKEILNESS